MEQALETLRSGVAQRGKEVARAVGSLGRLEQQLFANCSEVVSVHPP
jgi:hypothetical protein